MENKLLHPDKIHNWLSKLYPAGKYKYVRKGINEDDCAILDLPQNQIVITSDYLNANPIAKEFGICTNWDLGRLLVAANLSDLCGTGAKPIAMLTSLMFNKGTTKIEFKEFIKGVKFELDKHKIPLVGGDTKLGTSNSFCGIAIGTATQKMKLFTKSAAKPGDLIWVSGELGSVSASVMGLSQKIMSKQWNKWATKILIEPNIPISKSLKISRSRIGNGGTDISDGLGENLYNLCEASNVGATVFALKIPINLNSIALAKQLKIPVWSFGLNIGGDFQFIATGRKKHEKKFRKMGLYCIGEITKAKTKILVLDQYKQIPLPRIGHTDYSIKNFSEEVDDLMSKTIKLNT